MTLTALGLVLGAAVLHATWNFAAKRARSSGVAFVSCCTVISSLLWAPLALWLEGDQLVALPAELWWLAASSAVLHVIYFIALRHAYSIADLSVVYPVARGTGPLIAALTAVLIFGEPFSVIAALGLALIVMGCFTIGGGGRLLAAQADSAVLAGVFWGALIGLMIAAYTLNDGYAVRYRGAPPLLFDWLGISLRALLLAPFAWLRRDEVRAALRCDWRPILVVAALSPLAYILVLYAMTLAPVSLVAPARELSMLMAAFLGVRLLGEGELLRRLVGAGLIAVGVTALAWSH
jgi:drug/metabolite transporter (DMT)-like permease